MDQLADLLQQKRPNEPPQLQALRDYVEKHHGEKALTGISTLGYTLTVSSAPLASDLRLELPKIQAECHLDKKLFIRIGHIE